MSRSGLHFAISRLLIALALAVATVILGVTLSSHTEEVVQPEPPVEVPDSEIIVLEADVKDWEPIFPDGPIDGNKPDRQINVVKGNVIVAKHNWIARFKVVKVVQGVFDSDEIRMPIHYPLHFGIRDSGQRFLLRLRLRPERPKVAAWSRRKFAQSLSYFGFTEPLYELISAQPLPVKPAKTRKP
jgi:hypothetical protein